MGNKLRDKLGKTYDYILKLLICWSFGNASAAILFILGLPFNIVTVIVSYLISFSVGIPVIDNITKKMNLKEKRIKHQLYQVQCNLKESEAIITSRKIKVNKTLFVNEINAKRDYLDFDYDCLHAINAFLYMINENYYELIAKDYKRITREFLIDLLLTEIVKYFKRTDRKEFDIKDVEAILESLFFIDLKVRRDIIKEFKAAKITTSSSYQYLIISKNVTDEMLDEAQYDFDFIPSPESKYDITNPLFYEYIANGLGTDERNPSGDFSVLDWDYDFIMQVVMLIATEFSDVILKEKGKFNRIELATFFVGDVGDYAMVNHRKAITKVEIINTFKNWDYLSLETRVAIVDAIFAKFDLDPELYPFYKTKKISPRNNVIKFSDIKKG